MKHCKLFAIFSFAFVLLISNDKKIIVQHYQAGVVLTFDDVSVREWFEANKNLKRFSWKATFCVCKINTLNPTELENLRELENEGHEIAGHGLYHLNAVKFVDNYGIDTYMKFEINPMINLMKKKSFKITSFAYPDGERTTKLDSALLCKFKIIRGRDFGNETPKIQYCYYDNKRIVFGFDIDNNQVNFSIPYLIKLLKYAKKNNKILILCGHKIVNNVTANYQTKLRTLEFICSFIKQNNMKYYTLSDLNDLD